MENYYEFELQLNVDDSTDLDDLANRLYDEGFDDCLVSQTNYKVYIDFSGLYDCTFEEAVLNAKLRLENAGFRVTD